MIDHVSAQAITAERDRATLLLLVCNPDGSEVISSHFVKLEKATENPACHTQTWLASQPFSDRIRATKEDRALFAMVTTAVYGPASDGFEPVPFKNLVRMDVNVSGTVIY